MKDSMDIAGRFVIVISVIIYLLSLLICLQTERTKLTSTVKELRGKISGLQEKATLFEVHDKFPFLLLHE